MTNFTPQEQMLLEMANRARLDPTTEATNDGITLNQFIDTGKSGSISADPKQPLAGSTALETVAVNHDNQIVRSGILTQASFDPHNGANDGTAGGRVTAAGFTLNPTTHYHPENFDWQWTSGQVTDAMTIQAGNDLFKDDPKVMFGDETGGHRLALLDPNIKELGVGEVTASVKPFGQLTAMNASIITENFGNDTTKSFLTGAVYNDAVGPNGAAPDHFYSIGEGVQNVTATVKYASGAVIGTDVTGSGGGWSVAEPGGTYNVTFSGGGLATSVSARIEGGALNAKVDLVSGHEIDSSANATLLDGATGLRLLGIGNINGTGNAADNIIVGNAGNNILAGGGGHDSIDGGAGDDTLVLSGNQSSYKISVNGGTATIDDLRAGAPDGSIAITNIEHVKFADATVNYSDLKTTTAPAPVAGSVSIGDATITEGNSGSQIETFTVTRSGGNAAFDVHFATSDGTATTADSDYVAKSGALHFDAGMTTQTVSVVVNGDTKFEPNETYNVTLSGATNGATIAHAQGIGTIVNDDVAPVAGSVSIGDATITEGNSGSQIETFTVTRSGGSAAFDVHFATSDGTATTADSDYVAKSGALHFDAGMTTQTVSVVVNGDTKFEANETYNVSLSGATNGATIAHAQGIGTIVNDDVAPVAGSVSIGDATITEGNSGSQIETFTVTRSGGSAAFDVNFATSDGTATTADSDYVAKSGALHFDAGMTTQTVSVVVNGDTKFEANETYNVTLSAATNGATIAHAQGIGTIVNDDVAPVHHVANDFNGDGMSDLLLGKADGSLALWELNGNHIASNLTVGSVATGWHVDGVGDFGNDGKADILLHSDSGQVALWQMDGNHIVSNTTVGSIGTDWHVASIADFNGDGNADILWENSKGQVAMWQMDGSHIISNTTVGTIGTDWHTIGTGDFNGDGKADIVLENSTGQVAMWQMDGNHLTSNTAVGSITPDFQAVGIGEFNGDGKADILWQNSKGQVVMWQMDGNHIATNTTVGSAPGWTVIGTGDYNHDGKADVLLQNASGTVAQWQMNGDHVVSNQTVASHSTDWHML